MNWFKVSLVFGILAVAPSVRAEDASSYEAEKAKALKNPYANDFGPATIDVSSYPAEIQETYKKYLQTPNFACQRCHTASRPLNSQFVEPSAPKEQHPAVIAKWKAEHPELFADKLVWQIEGKSAANPGIWERYVKKMMSKPGCNISPVDGKKIWQFLTYDSEHRKTGANAAKWGEHRRKLLADFKAKYPDRYRELYEVQ